MSNGLENLIMSLGEITDNSNMVSFAWSVDGMGMNR